jgi:hypothetical protein
MGRARKKREAKAHALTENWSDTAPVDTAADAAPSSPGGFAEYSASFATGPMDAPHRHLAAIHFAGILPR